MTVLNTKWMGNEAKGRVCGLLIAKTEKNLHITSTGNRAASNLCIS